jgi:hypothetical protein
MMAPKTAATELRVILVRGVLWRGKPANSFVGPLCEVLPHGARVEDTVFPWHMIERLEYIPKK